MLTKDLGPNNLNMYPYGIHGCVWVYVAYLWHTYQKVYNLYIIISTFVLNTMVQNKPFNSLKVYCQLDTQFSLFDSSKVECLIYGITSAQSVGKGGKRLD